MIRRNKIPNFYDYYIYFKKHYFHVVLENTVRMNCVRHRDIDMATFVVFTKYIVEINISCFFYISHFYIFLIFLTQFKRIPIDFKTNFIKNKTWNEMKITNVSNFYSIFIFFFLIFFSRNFFFCCQRSKL